MSSLEDILSELDGSAQVQNTDQPQAHIISSQLLPAAASETVASQQSSSIEPPNEWIVGASQPAPGARLGYPAPSVSEECTRHAALAQVRSAVQELCQGAALEAAIRGGAPGGRLPSAKAVDAKSKPPAALTSTSSSHLFPSSVEGALDLWLVSLKHTNIHPTASSIYL